MTYDILYCDSFQHKLVEKNFDKTLTQLKNGDFKSADVCKMLNNGYYRAKLDIKDRVLFKFVNYQGKKYILLLEIIKEHNYAASRFLRGAININEGNFTPIISLTEQEEKTHQELAYLHPKNKAIHVLNKFISFDAIQHEILNINPPLIIVGSAGSGKTALILEKLKNLAGNVAYITLSKFLVENANALYYSGGYENENQEVAFLSLNDYLASWEKPKGKEIYFRAFEGWFNKHSQALKIKEAHRVYEEFKGVLTGAPMDVAWLSKENYMALGIKQSIFNAEEREILYPLFLKYLAWMAEENWYDSNIVCFNYLEKVVPTYDFIVIDEVQDITNIQLKCILQGLTNPANFILTGDSNQIVHPNFFSWSKIKTYLLQQGDLTKKVQILQTNYRNSAEVVTLSNNLLKIKNTRFGSIDKESTFLINTINKAKGEVLLYSNDEKKKNELNKRTQNSTEFAVIVTDNIYKAEAKKFFKTPLIFSVQEAKGLEYDNVILVNFISNNEAEFKEIINGVTNEDLEQEELQYSRAANKSDKDAEIYKFYINSFYVAITRAIKNIYLFEQKVSHPALQLLKVQETLKGIEVVEKKSTREEWLLEAQRLEDQGKEEQAEQIRAKYLGYEYISKEDLELIVLKALDPTKTETEVKKERKQLFEYAQNHNRLDWIEALANLQLQRAMLYIRELRQVRKDFTKNIRTGKTADVLNTIKKYGIHFTDDDGSTCLMLSLLYGQHKLTQSLLELNAPIKQTNKTGLLAIDYLVEGFYKTTLLKHQQLATLNTVKQFWHVVKPQTLTYDVLNKRLQISNHSMLFYLVILLRNKEQTQPYKARFKNLIVPNGEPITVGFFSMDDIVALANLLPDEILPPYRKNRTYINSVLAANEVSHDGQSSCKLAFIRVKRGHYALNVYANFKIVD